MYSCPIGRFEGRADILAVFPNVKDGYNYRFLQKFYFQTLYRAIFRLKQTRAADSCEVPPDLTLLTVSKYFGPVDMSESSLEALWRRLLFEDSQLHNAGHKLAQELGRCMLEAQAEERLLQCFFYIHLPGTRCRFTSKDDLVAQYVDN